MTREATTAEMQGPKTETFVRREEVADSPIDKVNQEIKQSIMISFRSEMQNLLSENEHKLKMFRQKRWRSEKGWSAKAEKREKARNLYTTTFGKEVREHERMWYGKKKRKIPLMIFHRWNESAVAGFAIRRMNVMGRWYAVD